jgi:hypothetical protein
METICEILYIKVQYSIYVYQNLFTVKVYYSTLSRGNVSFCNLGSIEERILPDQPQRCAHEISAC